MSVPREFLSIDVVIVTADCVFCLLGLLGSSGCKMCASVSYVPHVVNIDMPM